MSGNGRGQPSGPERPYLLRFARPQLPVFAGIRQRAAAFHAGDRRFESGWGYRPITRNGGLFSGGRSGPAAYGTARGSGLEAVVDATVHLGVWAEAAAPAQLTLVAATVRRSDDRPSQGVFVVLQRSLSFRGPRTCDFVPGSDARGKIRKYRDRSRGLTGRRGRVAGAHKER